MALGGLMGTGQLITGTVTPLSVLKPIGCLGEGCPGSSRSEPS